MATKEMVKVLTDEQAAALLDAYPVEQSFVRIHLPRLGLVSQDKHEGRGKNAVLVAEAGMFYTEQKTDELDENGKAVYAKTDLGSEIEGVIVFQRKQLRFYDEANQEYTSSPIYDSNEELVPLFKNKVEIARNTPDNLKKMYPGLTRLGKPTSKLNEDRILYVVMGEDLYQMNLHGTSMYAFLDYARKNPIPTVVTDFGSEAKEAGATNWNQMTFKVKRRITPEEAQIVLAFQAQIKEAIAAEKAYYKKDDASSASASVSADKTFDALTSGNN